MGWIRVRSPLLTESRLLSLPGGTEMVHFPPFASMELCIHSRMTELHSAGLPHSEIPGSTPACGSPRLIAACHVLHRLSAPRHPPYTLNSLTNLECLADRRILSLQSSIQLSMNLGSLGSALASPLATAHPRSLAGGADRVRTDDLRLARAALSQLSYSPDSWIRARPASGGPR